MIKQFLAKKIVPTTDKFVPEELSYHNLFEVIEKEEIEENQNEWTLRFDKPQMEREFCKFFYGKRARRLKSSLIFGVIFWSCFVPVDFMEDITYRYPYAGMRLFMYIVLIPSIVLLFWKRVYRSPAAIEIIIGLIQVLICAIKVTQGSLRLSHMPIVDLAVIVSNLMAYMRTYSRLPNNIACISVVVPFCIVFSFMYNLLSPLPKPIKVGKILMFNIITLFVHLTGFLYAYFVEKFARKAYIEKKKKEAQQEIALCEIIRSKRILENIMPMSFIPTILKEEIGKVQRECVEFASVEEYVVPVRDENCVNCRIENVPDSIVLLLNIVSFKQYTVGEHTISVMSKLHKLFSWFDDAVKDAGLEKVKSFGDSYLITTKYQKPDQTQSWPPKAKSIDVDVMALFAFSLQKMLKEFNEEEKCSWEMRICISKGPLVCAVMGHHKYTYDCFGQAIDDVKVLLEMCPENGILITTRVKMELDSAKFIASAFEDHGVYVLERIFNTLGSDSPTTVDCDSSQTATDHQLTVKQPLFYWLYRKTDEEKIKELCYYIVKKKKEKGWPVKPILRFLTELLGHWNIKVNWKSLRYGYQLSILNFKVAVLMQSFSYAILIAAQLSTDLSLYNSVSLGLQYALLGISIIIALVFMTPLARYTVSALVMAVLSTIIYILFPWSMLFNARCIPFIPLAFMVTSISISFFSLIPVWYKAIISLVLMVSLNIVKSILQRKFNIMEILLQFSIVWIPLLPSGYMIMNLTRAFMKRESLKIEEEVSKRHRERNDIWVMSSFPDIIGHFMMNSQTSGSLSQISVCFIRITDFKELLATDVHAVSILSEIFLEFDNLTLRTGCQKIKSTGDIYIAVSGLDGRSDHMDCIAKFALVSKKALRQMITCRETEESIGMSFKMGIHSGPMITGIIGKTKCSYDVFGEAVSGAYYLMQNSSPDGILVSESTESGICKSYECVPHGPLNTGPFATNTFLLMCQVSNTWSKRYCRTPVHVRSLSNSNRRIDAK